MIEEDIFVPFLCFFWLLTTGFKCVWDMCNLLKYIKYIHIAVLILIAKLLGNYLIVSSPQVNYRI